MNPENIVAAIVTALSFILFVISLNSYRRAKKVRILMIGIAFLIFFIKGLIMTVVLFYFMTLQTQMTYIGLLDMVILILLFAAMSIQK